MKERRKYMHGKRRRSPILQNTVKENIGSFAVKKGGMEAVKDAIGGVSHAVSKRIGPTLAKSILPIGIATTMFDFYRSGQEHSGGKVNPNQRSFMADAKQNTESFFKMRGSPMKRNFGISPLQTRPMATDVPDVGGGGGKTPTEGDLLKKRLTKKFKSKEKGGSESGEVGTGMVNV
tara:strand:- start:80 stop:607 length:528 start_codon:yes stop_codon:yes gene_type:complete